MLDERPQRIAMRGHEHALAGPESRCDLRLPIREHARDRVLQALRHRNVDALVAAVARDIVGAAGFDRRRRHVEAAPPDMHLLGADFLAHRSEEHTSELQSLMRNSYAVFCLKKINKEYE